jgi:peptidyl-dipeptidase Dcp
MAHLRCVAIAGTLVLFGCGRAAPVKFTPDNPFAAASTLQYQAPPFDKIHDGDFQPALEEGMRLQIA